VAVDRARASVRWHSPAGKSRQLGGRMSLLSAPTLRGRAGDGDGDGV
jgi:hypothetical protein